MFFPVCGFLFFGDAFEGAAGVEAFEEAADAVDVEVTGAAHGGGLGVLSGMRLSFLR